MGLNCKYSTERWLSVQAVKFDPQFIPRPFPLPCCYDRLGVFPRSARVRFADLTEISARSLRPKWLASAALLQSYCAQDRGITGVANESPMGF